MPTLAHLASQSRLLLGAALCLCSPVAHAAEAATSDPVVMTIDGEPVSSGEYRLVMQRHTAVIYGQFSRDKKLEDYPGYWSPESGPEGPLAKLRERVATELVKIKVSQILARQYGLASDISFEAFLKQRDAENARRANALQTGQIIYGPQHYRLSAYYYIQLRDLEFRLKQTMIRESSARITDAEVARYYAENSAIAKKPLAEVRLGIVDILSTQKTTSLLERLCAEAKITTAAPQLAKITPRSDEPAAAQ